MSQKILVISGGVGGAKLALGFERICQPDELAIMVNTGDDFDHLGLRICPDLDTTLYTLGGVSNTELGWGRADESWNTLQTLSELGGEDWFRLGDKDIALHLLRTQALSSGKTLSDFIEQTRQRLGIRARIYPMSNDQVATKVETDEGRLPFQHYFVKRQCKPVVKRIDYVGAESAQPLPEILSLLQSPSLQAVVIAPSNPFLSVAPILALPGLQDALKQSSAPVVAVSPVIGGEAVKGPTAKIMQELDLKPCAKTVADYYGLIIDGFVLDSCDSALQNEIKVPALCTNTLMKSLDDREQLAAETLAFARQLSSSKKSTEVNA